MLFIRVTLFALLCKVVGIDGKAIHSFAGPYIIYTERFYMCEPPNRSLPWRWHVRATHFNPYKPKELQVVTGNLTATNVTIDDSCWGKVILDIWANNQWKENAFVFVFKNKACTALKENLPRSYELIFKKREINGQCKLRPGFYEAENVPLGWIYPNLPIMPYGLYKLRMSAGKTDLALCFVVDMRVIPKVN